ncbi:MAG TPA: pyrimidine dimer DNA glycosylase/endonuclease V [Methanosarcina sp.]|nr:pyrimidine dimer DNA glycosylase/endonuclease V [Methanosarcina sp.]
MTRINVVPVEELCDQHLFAEFRELTRIPNGILAGKLKTDYSDRPTDYTLGKGHVKFFTDKLDWLFDRYNELYWEFRHRNYNVVFVWPSDNALTVGWFNYHPTHKALSINKARILERMPIKARWTNRKPPIWVKHVSHTSTQSR